jgi:tRNA pseudouridine38-40 synthase
MPRFFIKLSFDGTAYHGWQSQTNANTVQQELEKALAIIFKSKITVTGAGRTDTGVHAKNYFAHFDFSENISDEKIVKRLYQLNCILPDDICIHEIFRVNDNAHARFDATFRTYRYYISTQKRIFNREYSYPLFEKPDLEKMNEAASHLLSITDFTSFAKLHSQTSTNNCKVTKAFWEKNNDTLIFTITADRFLRNMVRSIVGTLLDVGTGRISFDEFKKIIESKNRSKAGFSVPAKGLFLEEIQYPETIFGKD